MKFLEAVQKAGEQNYILDKNGTPLYVKDNMVIAYDGTALDEIGYTSRTDWKIGRSIEKGPSNTVDFFKAVEALKSHKTIKSVDRDYFYRLTTGGLIECQHDGDAGWDQHMGLDGDEMNGLWEIIG